MTDRKDKSAPVAARDRSDALRPQNGPTASGSKLAEMATLTAAASGLALGAIDMGHADDDMFGNNVFARVLRDDPDEPLELIEDRPDTAEGQTSVSQTIPILQQPDASAVTNANVTEQIAIDGEAIAAAAKADQVEASRDPVDAAFAHHPDGGELQAANTAMQMSGGPASVAEKLTEGIATQISSGIDRVFDEVASGTLQPGFAQELASEIVSNVRSMLDDALPTVADLGSTIRADIAETLGTVGDDAGLLASSTEMIDQLTGRVDDMLTDTGLITAEVGSSDGLGSTADTLASLPAAILGGSDGTPGMLGELFYDDGAASTQPLDLSANSISDAAHVAVSNAIDALPVDLGFIGQSDPGDAGGVLGFSGNSNPLHLV